MIMNGCMMMYWTLWVELDWNTGKNTCTKVQVLSKVRVACAWIHHGFCTSSQSVFFRAVKSNDFFIIPGSPLLRHFSSPNSQYSLLYLAHNFVPLLHKFLWKSWLSKTSMIALFVYSYDPLNSNFACPKRFCHDRHHTRILGQQIRGLSTLHWKDWVPWYREHNEWCCYKGYFWYGNKPQCATIITHFCVRVLQTKVLPDWSGHSAHANRIIEFDSTTTTALIFGARGVERMLIWHVLSVHIILLGCLIVKNLSGEQENEKQMRVLWWYPHGEPIFGMLSVILQGKIIIRKYVFLTL